MKTSEIFISRDIIFHEYKFPFHTNMTATEHMPICDGILGNEGQQYNEGWTVEWPSDHAGPDAPSPNTTAFGDGSSADVRPLPGQAETGLTITQGQALMDGHYGPQPNLGQDVAHGPTDQVLLSTARGSEDRLEDQGTGRGCREKKRPSHLEDYVCNSASSSKPLFN